MEPEEAHYRTVMMSHKQSYMPQEEEFPHESVFRERYRFYFRALEMTNFFTSKAGIELLLIIL